MKRQAIIDIKEKLIRGDRKALSKVITMVESSLSKDRDSVAQLFDLLLDVRRQSVKIGITGSPGVGKSSFLNTLLQQPYFMNKTVAVLTVDPSSSLYGGSIMGDKTRMSDVMDMKNIFIRPSPSKGDLGGMNTRTWETVKICEYAGFDYIFVETVGVGQSEIEITHLVDHVFMLLQPGSGDEIQGIKKGIMEVVDSFVISKSDLDKDLAHQSQQQLKNIIGLISSTGKTGKSIYKVSNLSGEGFAPIAKSIASIQSKDTEDYSYWLKKQWQQWILEQFTNHPAIADISTQVIDQVNRGELSHTDALIKLQEKFIQTCFKKY
ncbi:ArgK/MeaB family GTPase [Membranihabitans marinus]|uniref:ArgK/MeaB family GTPase n=1 Tax=Membranihabitans marinus TaxID=1227546 RepID=UPI001F002AF2|nr:GTP-binding protein [Membranihabitans marinus]